jgi:hypothetical protein
VPKAELKQTLQYSNANIFGEILNDITASFGTTTMPYSKENIRKSKLRFLTDLLLHLPTI